MNEGLGLPASFWIKVNKNGPIHPYNPELGKCWIWTLAGDKDGYGRLGVGSRTDGSYKTVKAHRLILAAKLGRSIDPGMVTEHSCDNPPCVNPEHLSEEEPAHNVADMINKGRQVDSKKRTEIQRSAGLQSNNKSGYKGVCWHKKSSKWRAHISVKERRIELGLHDNLEDAIAARKAGEEKYWGTK